MMSLTETVCGEKEGEEDDRWSVRGGGVAGWRGGANDAYLVGAFGRHVPMGDAEEA